MGAGRQETIPNLLETDIKIMPGACGSPLVRKDGRVVGVLVAGNGRSYALTARRLEEMLKRA
jgi:V8-like Glu-specific endopeptidase